MRFFIILALLGFCGTAAAEATADDPFLWLESVNSPRAENWVRQENARSLRILQADPRYQPFYAQSLALAQGRDRIPLPQFLAGDIVNLWQDEAHTQGLWRRATLPGYRKAAPDWHTLIDLDALSRAEHRTWVFRGATCYRPADRMCLVALSDGGEDAVTTREFDAQAGAFVPGGFALPAAKATVDWADDTTLIVGTDWGPGSMTESGYPFVIKRLKRGQALNQATPLFAGDRTDVSVQVLGFTDGQGHHAIVLQRQLDFFRSEFRLVTAKGTGKLNLPAKTDPFGFVHNQLIARINEAFGPGLAAGSIVCLDLAHPQANPRAVFVPDRRQSVDEVMTTANGIVAATEDNVRGRAYVFSETPNGWEPRRLDLPDNAAIKLVAASARDDRVFLEVTSFLLPTTLYLVDQGATAPPEKIKALPAKFDASRDTVEQFQVASSDGTKIPYFVVHPKTMKLDGRNPTLMTAYGGFQISMTPTYSPGLGKLWLEPGGIYVLANIRGGGEFGPAWHEAGLKTKRQHVYDDFAAVARDLIARHITSPAHLGIRGGSNGGLLMGVELEQHPDLWHAVIIDVPLLDMLRYEKIAAGASWVGEYGSTANPVERAFLARISPYNNLRPGTAYPTPFIFTTTKDDRVGPVHARKFAAKMESMGLPFRFYEAEEGGHAAGANLREKAQEEALEMTYLAQQTK